ncbi:RBM43 protein, partial [Pteruthius melanotis]|nr:RBM43 protein [Pteruthius melanotis]
QAFLSVTSVLDVAVFRDHFVLEELVAEMKKQSPALSFGPLRPEGQIAVRGPFPALRALREFLLLKAKSLWEEDRREGKSHQRPRRKLQEHRGAAERRNSLGDDARGEKQLVVLDTDIYHYMRHFLPKIFQANDVVVSGVTDGDITTVCIESAGRKAAAAGGLRVKKDIEGHSVELQKILRKERLCFKEPSRVEKQRYRGLCERLKPRYPRVLTIPYDTHVDVVGAPAEVLEFAEQVRR